jgi:hypothetical protein
MTSEQFTIKYNKTINHTTDELCYSSKSFKDICEKTNDLLLIKKILI